MGWADSAAGLLRGEGGKQELAQSASGALGTLGYIIFITAIFIGIGLFIYFFIIRNNVKAEIYKEYQGKLYASQKDMGRVVINKGQFILHLFWSKKRTPLPKAEYRMKRGRNDFYMFREDDNGNLHPIMPSLTDDKLKFVPQERLSWLIQDAREQEIKHKQGNEMWEKFKTIEPTLHLIIVFLIIYFLTKHIASNLDGLTGAFNNVAHNCLGK